MPAEDLMVQRINDWSKGPWGVLGPYKGPEVGFMFNSIGMHPYTNGMLGPFYRAEAVTTWPANFFIPNNYRGMGLIYVGFDAISPTAIWALFFNHTTTHLALECVAETLTTMTTASTIPTAGLPAKLAGDPGNGGRNSMFQFGTDDTITSAISNHQDVATTLVYAAITNATGFAPTHIIYHRDRYWAWGDATRQNRIHFSNPGALTYANTNFIDFGPMAQKAILGAWSLFDTLVVCLEDYSWWTIRFQSDPLLGEQKYIGHHLIPDYHVSVGTDGSALYFTGRDEGIVIISPDGIDRETFSHMRSGSWGAARRAVYIRQSGIILLPRFEGTSYMRVNGAWWELPGHGIKIYDAFEFSPTEYGLFGHTDAQGLDQNAVKTWGVWKCKAEMSIADLPQAFQGDVDFAAWKAPEGALAAIRKITVEFSGLANQSQFEVWVGYIHNGVEVAQVKVADLNTGGVVTGMNRFVFHPTRLPMSTSFEVSLKGCYRAALSEVLIHYDTQNQEAATNMLVA